MLINTLSFLIIFTFLALVHEFGHLIFAKRAGIRVFEFGIGFGPRLFSFVSKRTIYSLNLIPILAFVRIAGEGDSEEDKTCAENELFYNKSPLQKILTLVAGPLMNILSALIILILLIGLVGYPTGPSNEIGSIIHGSPADVVGLKVGDRLLSIDGKKFAKMDLAIEYIHKSPEKPLNIIVLRGQKKLAFNPTPKQNLKLKVTLLGFSPKSLYEKVDPLHSIYYGFEQVFTMIMMTLMILGKLLTGGVSLSDLAGPVGIAQITGRYAQTGLVSLVFFAAFLNVNIGILNLLPLPALDGGHLAFVLLELILRKPIDRNLTNKINYWGMIFLLGLMALITLNDIGRLFSHP